MGKYGNIFPTLSDDNATIDNFNWKISGALGSACSSLGSAAAAAANYPAIPDTAAQAAFSTSISEFSQGASACVTGVNANNTSDIQDAQVDFSAATTSEMQAITTIDGAV